MHCFFLYFELLSKYLGLESKTYSIDKCLQIKTVKEEQKCSAGLYHQFLCILGKWCVTSKLCFKIKLHLN